MITSLKSIQQKCGRGITPYQIRYALRRFEAMGFLVCKSSKLGRLITIRNWSTYQAINESFHNQVVKNVSDSPQQGHTIITPNKNEKNEKKGKKGKPSSSFPLSFEEQDAQRAAAANADALTAFLKH